MGRLLLSNTLHIRYISRVVLVREIAYRDSISPAWTGGYSECKFKNKLLATWSRNSRNGLTGGMKEKRERKGKKEREENEGIFKTFSYERIDEAKQRNGNIYSKHYGARSSFLIEIPSYFQSARVMRARSSPNSRFDAISLSLRSKCEKWDIFKKDRPDAFLDRSCFERALFPDRLHVRDIFLHHLWNYCQIYWYREYFAELRPWITAS